MIIAESQVATYALEVFESSAYKSTEDAGALETMYLAWIPTGQVDLLAQQLISSSSAFYTALGSPYKDLAEHVVPSFPVTAIATSGSTGSSGGNTTSSDTTSASSSSKTREDAIIGVVSSLGAITLIVLVFLVVRAIKQRRALAHRRLSDPQMDTAYVGARPENQDFDRDSLGGQRRRSFYYAEDSLRYDPTGAAASEAMMRERRPQGVNPQMIGAPVLRDNTMNW